MVVRGRAREHTLVQGLAELLVFALAEHDAALRPEEGLVGRARQHVRAFAQRILEASGGDQAQHMGAIEEDACSHLLAHRGEVRDRLGEEEQAPAEHADGRLLGTDEVARLGHVDRVAVGLHRPGVNAPCALAQAAHAGVADVPTARDRMRHGRRGVRHEAREDGLVGHRPGDGADVGPLRAEEAAHHLGDVGLDLVHVAGALVVARTRMSFGIAMQEVRVEHAAGRRREQVLGCDQVERAPAPVVVLVHDLADATKKSGRRIAGGDLLHGRSVRDRLQTRRSSALRRRRCSRSHPWAVQEGVQRGSRRLTMSRAARLPSS